MRSLWLSETQLPHFQRLEEDKTADVLIIGGGIAGILTAYLLRRSGVDCMLVEKGRLCSGTTGNTIAKITVQHGLVYQDILRSYGLKKARHYLLANKAAFDMYARLCRDIDCDYERKDSYVYTLRNEKKLSDEISALGRIGFDARLCKSLPLPFDNAGAVRFAGQAQFSPLKFLSQIVKGLNIYEDTHVLEMKGMTAVTARGKVRAKRVVVATHFPFINKHGCYFLKLYQHRSYVLALENARALDGMYVGDSHTSISLRNYKDLLLVGGGGHKTGYPGGGWEKLRRFAKRYWPESTVRYMWAAQDCMSLDGIPYIGHYSENTPKLYVAAGFNKWGMTGAMTAAMILCDMLTGKENEYADVFDPSRSILKPQLFENCFESAKHILIPKRPRCPHLGCALEWNRQEHTWDCPCHGSRFDRHGRLLDNPANGDIKKSGLRL